jgi:hypothetical protein
MRALWSQAGEEMWTVLHKLVNRSSTNSLRDVPEIEISESIVSKNRLIAPLTLNWTTDSSLPSDIPATL